MKIKKKCVFLYTYGLVPSCILAISEKIKINLNHDNNNIINAMKVDIETTKRKMLIVENSLVSVEARLDEVEALSDKVEARLDEVKGRLKKLPKKNESKKIE